MSEEATAPEAATEATCSKLDQAQKIIKGNMLWTMGVGLIPVPIVDAAGIAALQLKMINELSHLYGIKFSEHRVKNIVGTLVATMAPVPLSGVVGLVKFIPVVGTAIGAVSVPIAAGASTYALGQVFNTHFAAGGTFLDLDPSTTEQYFREKFEEGKKIAADVKKAAK